MSTTIITVADVKPPAPGKKQASVIDSTGKRWGIKPEEMSNYRQFGTYEVERFKESYFNGKTYYHIESAFPVNTSSASTQAVSSYEKTAFRDAPPPRPAYSYDTNYSDEQRRMDIFVCGAFNNILSNPEMSPSNMMAKDFIAIINNLKTAWKATLGPNADQYAAGMVKPDPISSNKKDDMNDEIPF